jgi:hypothetical protein
MKRWWYATAVVLAGFLLLQSSQGLEPLAPVPYEADSEASPPEATPSLQIRLLEQGVLKISPAMKPNDALNLLTSIHERVTTSLAKSKAHPAFGKNAPVSLEEFEKFFWSMHVLQNQLNNTSRLLTYVPTLKPQASKHQAKAGDNTSALQADWQGISGEVKELRTKLVSLDKDWRTERVKLADKVLTDKSDVAERLLAALALDMDSEVLLPKPTKEKTDVSPQVQQIKQTIEHARAAAGKEFIQKSRLLFTGLHWWSRGRYGVGTTGHGLLKDAAALQSADVMFGLNMPINLANMTENDRVPVVDRRHHYLWQFESRQIVTGQAQESKSSKEYVPSVVDVTTMSHFY